MLMNWSPFSFAQGAMLWGCSVSLAVSLANALAQTRTQPIAQVETLPEDTVRDLLKAGAMSMVLSGIIALNLAGTLAATIILALALAAIKVGNWARAWVCLWTRAQVLTGIYFTAEAMLPVSIWASVLVGTFGWDEALAFSLSGLCAMAISGGLLLGWAETK